VAENAQRGEHRSRHVIFHNTTNLAEVKLRAARLGANEVHVLRRLDIASAAADRHSDAGVCKPFMQSTPRRARGSHALGAPCNGHLQV
jgi:hypothetical protein